MDDLEYKKSLEAFQKGILELVEKRNRVKIKLKHNKSIEDFYYHKFSISDIYNSIDIDSNVPCKVKITYKKFKNSKELIETFEVNGIAELNMLWIDKCKHDGIKNYDCIKNFAISLTDSQQEYINNIRKDLGNIVIRLIEGPIKEVTKEEAVDYILESLAKEHLIYYPHLGFNTNILTDTRKPCFDLGLHGDHIKLSKTREFEYCKIDDKEVDT